MRTRKKATMLAITTATMPPAEAEPTSYWIGVDQEGDVGGRKTRTAAGGDEDLGEHRQQEDGLDQDDHGDRARQVRQRDIDEARECAGAVHLGGLPLLLV
jgi:hypothetical protein